MLKKGALVHFDKATQTEHRFVSQQNSIQEKYLGKTKKN